MGNPRFNNEEGTVSRVARLVNRIKLVCETYSVRHMYHQVAKNPKALLSLWPNSARMSANDIQDSAKIVQSTEEEIEGYLNEFFTREAYRVVGFRQIEVKEQIVYCIIRCLKPEKVVETGCFYGRSSYAMLKALHLNNHGHLYSIDVPAYYDPNKPPTQFSLPVGKQVGWVVPDYLRDRWELLLGKSKDVLPALLERIGEIDIFFHDLDHSYENMMFEYETAFPMLRQKGILMSDDTSLNSSFDDFVSKYSLKTFKARSGGAGVCVRD